MVCWQSVAQSIDLKGLIKANEDLVGIHVLNISAKKYTVSDNFGRFEVPVRINDTLEFRSVQYEPLQLIIDRFVWSSKKITVVLNDRINQLDEVVVGKILTGDLLSDIENSDAKRDINFYDVGIPGYTGKPKTQSERKLYEADNGDFVTLYATPIGPGIAINLHKILNRINGRTKKLKANVLLDAQKTCMKRAQSEFSALLFGNEQVEDHLKDGFFLFAAEDPSFDQICNQQNSMAMYQFLVSKLVAFHDDDLALKD